MVRPEVALMAGLITWTGGSRPPRRARGDIFFRALRHRLWRDQATLYRGVWGDLPRDVARIFWKRASYDAWANTRRRGE